MTRLRNTRTTLPWDTVADILTEFCLRLKWSWYNSAYRAEVIYSAVTGFQEADGPGGQGREVLAPPTVTFIPATPGGKLTKHLREVLQEEGSQSVSQ